MKEQGDASALGKAITIRRIELGLSRNDLRDRCGLSYPYVAELEKGAKTPSARALDAIARALELRPHELLARAEVLAESASGSPAPEASAAAPPRPAREPSSPSRSLSAIRARTAMPASAPAPRSAPAAPPPAAAAPPAAAPLPGRRRWFGSASDTRAEAASPVAAGSVGSRPPAPLTEERVREIVREELRRLISEAAQ